MIKGYFRAETIVSVLLGMVVFSMIFLSFHQWYSTQIRKQQQNDFRQQALQIIDNQIARQFVGLPCENQVIQNQRKFVISCSETVITVSSEKMTIKIVK